ncbi:MAG TPA: F0F1 ATP synthase subunit A [Blastocatellia bacterium]|nr:F0F1 ATP synthase subunit A [Blastocatellia bacterium]
MLLALYALIQETGGNSEHSPGEAATSAAHEPVVVEWVNHVLGPAVLKVERAILPPIYGLLGAEWHEPAPGELIIPEHVVWAVLLVMICVAGALLLRGRLSVDRPSKGQQLLEIIVEQIRSLLDQVIGPYGRRYVPVIGSFAVFILIGNLMGQIPGLGAPTESINVTGALGLTSFLYYISTGFRQQGIGYLKHFTGGLKGPLLLAIGPLIFVVEIISNSVRPVTLSLRLFVNMFADHKIGSSFLSMVAPLVPVFTIVLGVFVSFVQTFIFIMLSMVYLSETVPHEEHDVEEHGHAAEAPAH